MSAEVIELDHRPILGCDYAVINPLQVDEVVWGDLPTARIVPASFRAQPQLFPVLLVLDDLDFDTRIGLLDRMESWESGSEYPYFSALLQSDATPSRVQRHLASLMERRHHGVVDLLRPHDPRVFRHLHWLLSEAQVDDLLGPVAAWTWREPGGLWRRAVRHHLSAATTLHLSQAQWDAYARIGLLNRLIELLRDDLPALSNDTCRAPELDSLLDTAMRVHHLSDADDRCLFAQQAVCIHPHIHAHPTIAERLHHAADGQVSYTSACASLDAEAMRQLVHDIDRQRTERITS